MVTERLCENYAKEFIVRTRKIFKQYEDLVIDKLEGEGKDSEVYDITLLFNCFYGLLMMPSKMNRNRLSRYFDANDFLSKNGFNDVITFETNLARIISLEEFVRSIRNGLGHWEENNHNKNFEDENYGLDFEPKTPGNFIKTIIVRGSFGDRGESLDITTRFTIDTSMNRNNLYKILDFLEFILQTISE